MSKILIKMGLLAACFGLAKEGVCGTRPPKLAPMQVKAGLPEIKAGLPPVKPPANAQRIIGMAGRTIGGQPDVLQGLPKPTQLRREAANSPVPKTPLTPRSPRSSFSDTATPTPGFDTSSSSLGSSQGGTRRQRDPRTAARTAPPEPLEMSGSSEGPGSRRTTSSSSRGITTPPPLVSPREAQPFTGQGIEPRFEDRPKLSTADVLNALNGGDSRQSSTENIGTPKQPPRLPLGRYLDTNPILVRPAKNGGAITSDANRTPPPLIPRNINPTHILVQPARKEGDDGTKATDL